MYNPNSYGSIFLTSANRIQVENMRETVRALDSSTVFVSHDVPSIQPD